MIQSDNALYVRSLIEASLDPLVTISPDGKIMDVNTATEKITGIHRKQLIGSDFSDYFTQPDKARAGYLQVFSEGFVTDYPLSIRHVDGHITQVLYNASLYRNPEGEVQGIFAAARDVTSQKQAEAKLHEASIYARSLIEASLDPLVTISLDGKIMDVNCATEKITGAPREQLVGTEFSVYFTEPDKARQGYQQVFSNGFVKDYPLSIRHSSGTITDVLYNATVYKNHEGVIQGVFAAARDITDQKQAEGKLHEASWYARSLIEASLDPLVTISPNGKIMDVNQATEHVTGVDREQLIGNDFSAYFTEPDKAQNGYQQVFLNGFVKDYPLSIRHSSGITTDVLYNATLYKNNAGEVQGIFAAARDITAQKQAEAKLEVIARYHKTLADALALFNSGFDESVIINNLLKLLADGYPFPVSAFYKYEEWRGQLTCIGSHGINAALKKDYQLSEGLVGEACASNREIALSDLDKVSSDYLIDAGIVSFLPQDVLLFPITHQERRMGVLVVMSLTKMTEDHKGFIRRLCIQLGVALHNFKQYEDLKLLAETLSQRNQQILEINQQLDDASRMKSDFLANMSHELRTPLNAIIGFSEALRDGMMGELSADQQEYCNDIFESGEHLLALINDILDLSKVEAGKMDLFLEQVEFKPLLESCLNIIKEKASSHQIKLILDNRVALNKLTVDRRRFKQIIYNLLSNAVKFSPEAGSITISAEQISVDQLPQPVALALKTMGDSIKVSITDTGIGIAKQDQQRLFQPFIQLDEPLSKKYQGTGLGLAMVKKLVELHGGTVTLSSELNQGSCFTIWLPVINPSSSAESVLNTSRRVAPLGKQGRGQGHVLVIEDDDKSADLMRLQLEQEGLTVQRACSAEEGFRNLDQQTPDLIILDILLPGINGWAFLQHIREQPRFASLPVVIVSITTDAQMGLSLGASKVLQKPVSFDVLKNALQELGIVSPFKNLNVLVVDDDPYAIRLISQHLAQLDIEVIEAHNGSEGIAHAINKQPSLIILDLMMPGMNGFEVVEALKENESTKHTPIFILTAKILTEQDEKQLRGNVVQIMEKNTFNHGRFINEVRRVILNNCHNKNPQPGQDL
jgi:PAS domain S-box-containing protein